MPRSSAARIPERAEPTADAPGFTIDELCAESGLSARAIRLYIARGVLARPVFRGTQTRYDADSLLRLRAAARLRKRGKKYEAIRRELAKMSPDALARLGAPDEAPATTTARRAEAAARPLAAGFLGPYRPALARASERWERIVLCPGVELSVRGEADAEAWRVAQEIVATFGTPKG